MICNSRTRVDSGVYLCGVYLCGITHYQMLRTRTTVTTTISSTPASNLSSLPCCCLVTACGSAPACGVIRALHQYPPVDSHGHAAIRVIGVDCRPDNPGRFLVDLFALLPPVADGVKAYLSAALTLCKEFLMKKHLFSASRVPPLANFLITMLIICRGVLHCLLAPLTCVGLL